MSLSSDALTTVRSLLQSIVLMDGEALVLHVGDKPYVVAESGQVSLANSGLTSDTISQVLDHMLPPDARQTLADMGATQCVLPPDPMFPDDRFSVVAARGGDDIWVEIRRAARSGEETASESVELARSPITTAGGVSEMRVGRRSDPVTSPTPPQPSLIEAVPPFELRTAVPPTDDGAAAPAVVLPLTRTPLRSDVPPPLAEPAMSGIDRLLRLAAARGASTLYVMSGARPAIRLDGDLQTLDSAAVLSASDVESLLLTLRPERTGEALRRNPETEWVSEFPDLGRVRCLTFRDQRGPGAIFRIIPQRAVSAEQLGLSREIQALADQPDGLVLVTGPRLSGKRTLMAALVDQINRGRRAHVISIERAINIVHDPVGSVVSQRQVDDRVSMAAAARAAVREDPDVLVVEDVGSPALVEVVLEAAAMGRLVIGGLAGTSTVAAVDMVVELCVPAERERVQLLLAQHLRAVVAQVLLKKSGGGRLAARELLLNTPAVAGLLVDGKTSQLPLAIEGGRKQGMVPLNDALGGFVQSGAVDVREAYRWSVDRPGLLALLQRQGVDVSAVERLA